MRRALILLLLLTLPASAAVRTSGNVIVGTANEQTFPFDRPFDLEGRTLRFTPDGAAYRVESQGLQWIDDAGPLFATLNTRFESSSVTPDGFGAIRFGAQELTRNAQLRR